MQRFLWTPNKITALRVIAGFAAILLFGCGRWAKLGAVVLTVISIALDALDGHLARKKRMETPMGAQLDILGDRLIENVYFTYFAVIGMVSLWLPVLFFARGAAVDLLRNAAFKMGRSGWGGRSMLETGWSRMLVASRWSRGLYAAMKCICFCYLGLELALTRGSAVDGNLDGATLIAIRLGAQILTWVTAAFSLVRGVPVCVEGYKYVTRTLNPGSRTTEELA
jgi:CDP-diacylglycerol---glycerol-3-phosphate 3-phosphatidyltransferase